MNNWIYIIAKLSGCCLDCKVNTHGNKLVFCYNYLHSFILQQIMHVE